MYDWEKFIESLALLPLSSECEPKHLSIFRPKILEIIHKGGKTKPLPPYNRSEVILNGFIKVSRKLMSS